MLSSLNQPSLKALGESMSSLGLTGNSLLNKQNVMKDSFIKYLRVSYIWYRENQNVSFSWEITTRFTPSISHLNIFKKGLLKLL